MENVETIFEGLLELVRLDMQLRKTGKETAERRQVEDAINSVRAKLPEPILGRFDRQKSTSPLVQGSIQFHVVPRSTIVPYKFRENHCPDITRYY
jgi:hypothetical protein